MITQAQIRLVRSLKDRKARLENSLFVVEGEKMVQEVCESSFEVEEIFRVEDIGEQAMSRISLLSSPSPVLALVRIPPLVHSPQSFSPAPGGLSLCLDSIRDPGNMGTILRLSDWFGTDAVIASRDSVDIFNPKVVQSTMGAIFRVKFLYADLPQFLSGCGADIFGTFLSGENIYEADLSSSAPGRARIIVTGNESNGISPEVGALCRRRITIPSFSRGRGSESLNAAVATAICVSEFIRRG